MARNDDNKAIVSIVIGIIGAFAIGGAFTSWFNNGWLSIIGVLLGFALGIVFYKYT